MSTKIRGIVAVALLVVFVAAVGLPTALGASAKFNDHPKDLKTLVGMNFSRNPDCRTCWENNTVRANVGETVSFQLYYHNFSEATAENTRARIMPEISSDGRTITVNGRIWADNAPAVSDTVKVNITGGRKATRLTHIATFWYPNRSQTSRSLAFGQDGSEIARTDGAKLGDIGPDGAFVGFVVARFKIEGVEEKVVEKPIEKKIVVKKIIKKEVVKKKVVKKKKKVCPPAEADPSFTLEADKRELDKGRIDYTLSYHNDSEVALENASIEVRLADELEFVDASRLADEEGRAVVFNLGRLEAGEQGSITVEAKAEDLEEGDSLRTAATLTYTDENGEVARLTVNDVTQVEEEDLAGGVLTASIGDAFSDLFGNVIFWLVVGLVVLYLLYRFFVGRRETAALYPPRM